MYSAAHLHGVVTCQNISRQKTFGLKQQTNAGVLRNTINKKIKHPRASNHA